ncbi:hypothetical protein C2845_PM12G09980 [Panicum miliaceum]|uniref:Uncharacterized protein n=1 Tax=Panicum miliaceum TaxID=4540 RepID=A0A3L6QF69_PANMI|nr:hypothetical protein C2845_PM12G09980 [Panicum miliaceum]
MDLEILMPTKAQFFFQMLLKDKLDTRDFAQKKKYGATGLWMCYMWSRIG